MAGCRQEQDAQRAEVEGDEARSTGCRLRPAPQPAQSSPPQPELLGRQKLSATTLKCPGISGGANLQLWPAPLSGTRFVRSGVVASGGRVATRVCGASSFLLPGWRGPRASVGEKVVVGEWSCLVVTWRRAGASRGLHWLAAAARKDRGKQQQRALITFKALLCTAPPGLTNNHCFNALDCIQNGLENSGFPWADPIPGHHEKAKDEYYQTP